MSLVIQHFIFKSKKIRFVLCKNTGSRLFIPRDIYETVGYSHSRNGRKASRRYVPEKYKTTLSEIWNEIENIKDFRLQSQTKLINKEGLRLFLTRCKMPKAVEFARQFGINIESSLCVSKEQDTLGYIMKAFDGEKMKYQFVVDDYRIDLYFPKYKIAVECDELGHHDRDISYEIKRQKYLENLLGCQFIRFNPDAEHFCIFKVINDIFKTISR